MKKTFIFASLLLLLTACNDSKNISVNDAEKTTFDSAKEQSTNSTKEQSTHLVELPENLMVSTEYRNFHNGLLIVQDNDSFKYGAVDVNGHVIIEPKFEYLSYFSDNLAVAQPADSDSYGYINMDGEWVIEPQYFRAYPFTEGLALVNDNNTHFYIDTTGNTVLSIDYPPLNGTLEQNSIGFSEGLAPAFAQDGRLIMGFIDKLGNWVIEPKFKFVSKFSEGFALAQDLDTSLFGFINESGDWEITPQYMDNQVSTMKPGVGYSKFSEGYAFLLGDNGLFGFIDKTGNWVIEPTFTDANHFSESWAAVDQKYINHNGEELENMPEFASGENFEEGYAPIYKNFKWFILRNSNDQ